MIESFLPRLAQLAVDASKLILSFRQGAQDMEVRWKGEHDPVTLADQGVHQLCADTLAQWDAKIPLLSEEGIHPEVHGEFWSLDPVDGTSEFVEDLGEYAFQLALIRDGQPVVGVLAIPAQDVFYVASAGGGCTIHSLSQRFAPHAFTSFSPLRRERLVVTRSLPRRQNLSKLVEAHPAQDIVLLGGVGYKVHAILTGEADTYFAAPNTLRPWDLAAPLLIAREAGLVALATNGQELSVPAHDQGLSQGVLFTREIWKSRNLEFLAIPEMATLLTQRDPR